MRYSGLMLIMLMMLTMLVSIVVSTPVTVTTDKTEYYRGDIVTITVTTVNPNTLVAVEIRDPKGRVVWVEQVTTGADNKATFKFKIKSDAIYGTYTVYASAEGEPKGTCTFKVVPVPPPPPLPPKVIAETRIKAAEKEIKTLDEAITILSNITRLVEAPKYLEEALTIYNEALRAFEEERYEDAKAFAEAAIKKIEEGLKKAIEEVATYIEDVLEELREVVIPEVRAIVRHSSDYILLAKTLPPMEAIPWLIKANELVRMGLRIVSLYKAHEDVTKELEAVRKKITVMETELRKLETENTELKSKVERLEEDYSALKSEYEKVSRERVTLSEENKKLKERVTGLEGELSLARILEGVLFIVGLAIGVVVAKFVIARRS